jgi:(p)ppGpp synthase/HD superfamily hydrolase
VFADTACPVRIVGREKTLYSVYRKMDSKHLSFSQVTDIYGFRIVVPELTDCYTGLGICCTSSTSRCRASSATTWPSPRSTATSRCTPR